MADIVQGGSGFGMRYHDNGDGTYSQIEFTESTSNSAVVSSLASANTNATLLPQNLNRKGLLVFNDSTAILYIKFGAIATTSSYTVQVAASGYFEFPLPVYTGQIDVIWASTNGNARITEQT